MMKNAVRLDHTMPMAMSRLVSVSLCTPRLSSTSPLVCQKKEHELAHQPVVEKDRDASHHPSQRHDPVDELDSGEQLQRGAHRQEVGAHRDDVGDHHQQHGGCRDTSAERRAQDGCKVAPTME
jgi:hypothetical protein